MRPPNYRQAKNQKEQKRKLRQQEKQQRRSTPESSPEPGDAKSPDQQQLPGGVQPMPRPAPTTADRPEGK
jgi:hypothetical protein